MGAHWDLRVTASGFDYGRTAPATAGDTSTDAFRGGRIGGVLEGTYGADSYALKGFFYRNQIADDGGTFDGGSANAGYIHRFAGGGVADVQAYFSRDDRDQPTLFERRDTFDVQAQHSFQAGERHNIVWGGEYRLWREDFLSFDPFMFANPRTNISLGAVFGQDEIALKPDLKLTAGLKLEDNSYSGFDWMPNVRLAWSPSENEMLWAAVSRAVRTPNRIERELEDPGFLAPSPDFQSEKLVAFEAGWRAEPSQRSSLSLSAFYNIYTDLRTDEFSPTIFPIVLANGAKGETYGVEAWGKYELLPWWRLSAGANFLHKSFRLKPGHSDLAQLQVQGQDPAYQLQLRSQMDLPHGLRLDLGLRGVDHVDLAPVPGYVEADAHLSWRVARGVEVSIEGFNLLHDRHLEVYDPSTTPPRYIPRSVFARLRLEL